jgi:hypothetical protein
VLRALIERLHVDPGQLPIASSDQVTPSLSLARIPTPGAPV